MAPEQFRGKAFPTTGLYSLGATLLYLLTHRPPSELPANTLKIDFKSHVNISDNFTNWLDKVLEPDPEDRFKSAQEALSTLNQKISNPAKSSKNKLLFGLLFAITSIGLATLNAYKHDFLIKSNRYKTRLYNNAKLIKKYIKQTKNVNLELLINNENQPLLACLIGKADRQLIELLSLHSSQINDQNIYAKILIFYFVANDDSEGVQKLIDKSINVNVFYQKKAKQNYTNYFCPNLTPLYEAIRRENLAIVKLLVINGANLNEECNIFDPNIRPKDTIITPLSKAIYLNNAEIVEFLITNGADIDYSLIPITLSQAIEYQYYDVLKILLENGLDPTENNPFTRREYINTKPPGLFSSPEGGSHTARKNVEYKSLLHYAEVKQDKEVLKLFYKYI